MEIFKESTVQKEKFRGCANKLLNSCFLLKKKEDTRNDYIFLLQNKELFYEYFDLLGYKIDINEMYGVASLVSYTGTGRLRLKKNESILLLILRLLYIEKRKELSLNDDVVVTTEEIHQKYDMLNIDSKQKLDKSTLRSTFSTFRKYNLIQSLDSDILDYEARIKIYPSILFAITNENIDMMYNGVIEKLNTYRSKGDDDNAEDDDEEALQN